MSQRIPTVRRRANQVLAGVRRFFDTGNLFRFLLSLVLAFGLWALVTYQNDPETTRVIGGLAVTIENLEEDLEVVGDPPTVDVTIQGPQSVVTPLERESIVASIDMDGIDSTGEHELDVTIEAPSDVRVRDVMPDPVAIEIDQMSSRADVPITVTEPEDVPQNYQVRSIDVEPETVDLAGPERTLQQVETADVQIDIGGRTSNFTDSVVPRLLDANGNELSGVQLEPAEVSVTVTLDVRGQVRKVLPVVVGDDALEPGHELVRTTVLPTDEIVVDGPEDELAGVFFVSTEPIDITGWDESQIVRDVQIDQGQLPDGVEIEEDSVHVSVEIRRQVHHREVSDLPISTMNVASGTSVEMEAEMATVVLEGSRTAVEAVEPEDITVFVNLANAEPGEYDMELRVIVPAQVKYREVDPAFVEVVVIDNAEDNDG